MTQDTESQDYIVELLHDFGGVYAKRMFGGAGIFKDAVMFGLIADGKLYLKTDEKNINLFESLELEPFMYQKNDKQIQMSYSEAPEFALEEPEAMLEWAKSAFEAALRSKNKKRKR